MTARHAAHPGPKVKPAALVKVLMCPNCGSGSLRERPRNGSGPSYMCRACGKTTYSPRVKHGGAGSGVVAGPTYARGLHWGNKGWY
jgi:predicted RNA-binding Zn-ribbon protein involved in translation (DUF1610 family)